MVVQKSREATLGILILLLLGATLGAALLLSAAVIGSTWYGRILGTGLHDAFTTGDAFIFTLIAFFVTAPFCILFVAAIMGARAARTGNRVGGTSALTALYGVPLLWINMALAMLLAAAMGSTDFDTTLDLIIESVLPLVLVTGATVGFAALTGSLVRDAFTTPSKGRTAHEAPPVASTPPTEPVAAPEVQQTVPSADQRGPELRDYPVDCPRCQAHFTITGQRPLRIQCPRCGKTGLIR